MFIKLIFIVISCIASIVLAFTGCSAPAVASSINQSVYTPGPGYGIAWEDDFGSLSNWNLGNYPPGSWSGLEYITNLPSTVYLTNIAGTNMLVLSSTYNGYGISAGNYDSEIIDSSNHAYVGPYGVVAASIKMPNGGAGIWPAFWLLGSNNNTIAWPWCGEIDNPEEIDSSSNVYAHIHGPSFGGRILITGPE